MPGASRRVKQVTAFRKFFKETYNSARLAEKLVKQIKLRGTLRDKLKDARKINRLQQAHHIIPVETVMQSRLVQKAVLEGFEINGIENGIALSIAQHKKRHSELASYNRFVLQELFNLEAKYPNCTRAIAKREVDKLVKFLKQQF
jgi:A nuclease family of the HNH/ENDO VII superfamily with conserved AHH